MSVGPRQTYKSAGKEVANGLGSTVSYYFGERLNSGLWIRREIRNSRNSGNGGNSGRISHGI